MDFDTPIDRHHSYSTQWDFAADRFGKYDVLPFSISDTDFAAPPEVVDALARRLRHPVFGYTRWNHSDFKEPIVRWFYRRGKAQIDPDWIVYSPSVMWSVSTLIRLLSKPGEQVVVLRPLYDGFFGAIQANGRELVGVDLSADASVPIDYDVLAQACTSSAAKIFLLTNPHNPTGRVFTREELARMVDIARKTNTFVITDDIHRDIILGTVPYTPLTDITTEHVALACSGSKTFNIPGLIGSYAFVPDKALREAFLYELKQKNALSSTSIFGMYAQIAAYTRCDYYVDELNAYIRQNMHYILAFLQEQLPQIRFEVPQATYLAWMDISQLGVSSEDLQQACVQYGHVGIMSGTTYGDERFMRMCVGCPRTKLERGLQGLLRGVRGLKETSAAQEVQSAQEVHPHEGVQRL